MTLLSPSVYAADPFKLKQELDIVAPYSASFHMDIMDGVFTPDYGLNDRLIKELANVSNIPLDIHLMVSNPFAIVERYIEFNVRSISVQMENISDFKDIAVLIQSRNIKVNAALQPYTSMQKAHQISDFVDGFLFLTALAGGGNFDTNAFHRLKDRPKDKFTIVDGRIEPKYFIELQALNIDLAVIGSALFGGKNLKSQSKDFASQLSNQAA